MCFSQISQKQRQLYLMKKVCLPYKERFLDTILYGAKKILRAIHKCITSFFFFF